MGELLCSYKKAMIDELTSAISNGTSTYYAFASDPVAFVGNTPGTAPDDYSSIFLPSWQLLFGKRLSSNDILPLVNNTVWVSNTVYSRYDSTVDLSNSAYYVISSPAEIGGTYDFFVCIDNANGSPSTVQPAQVQTSSFQTSDGYLWRYVASVSNTDYGSFSSNSYSPIYANSSMSLSAYDNSGVEVVAVTSVGSGYITYGNGIVQSVVNSSLIQLDPTASPDNDFYDLCGIYIYNTNYSDAQLNAVKRYVSNTTGNWAYLVSEANSASITPSVTRYYVSPRVVFTTDADIPPSAYSVVDPVSNTIQSIVVVDAGYGYTWANASLSCNTSYGTGAALKCLVPPPGGHGADPVSELGTLGFGISFSFANSEVGTIPTEILYTRIGLLKDPVTFSNASVNFTSNTFSQLLVANVSFQKGSSFTIGDTVTGATSNALGTVAFSNSSVLYLTGDKSFSNGESVASSNGSVLAEVSITEYASIHAKGLRPLYLQNVSNVQRSNTQTESFLIQVAL